MRHGERGGRSGRTCAGGGVPAPDLRKAAQQRLSDIVGMGHLPAGVAVHGDEPAPLASSSRRQQGDTNIKKRRKKTKTQGKRRKVVQVRIHAGQAEVLVSYRPEWHRADFAAGLPPPERCVFKVRFFSQPKERVYGIRTTKNERGVDAPVRLLRPHPHRRAPR